ncbi:tetratricopeptide repeat protein [Parabacteroides sp. PF5-9]|uniref:type IX secretion system periplasmic lipoprotein PorW/SprE n=1 Tax=Parabacteroides sp. PF5-9 TaxID=1742404 RepID=UPI00247426C4|nr:tetratricopeptide repeat protein [Parabacteroides sp. PF5-9]MDH6356759.1 TolA-binding protein [Parabacteroides sp. PF5-9]
MRKGFFYIFTLLVISLLWSCSTKKNTKASRFYHAFNTRYNIYYNGKTAYDESLDGMLTNHKENYSELIHMHPISAQPKDKSTPGGPFDRTIEKSNKAIKLHSIHTKPPKKPGWRNDPKQVALQTQEEYNPFLKNSWLIMGKAQFYNADFLQASATFSYIARHYAQDPEVVAEAKLWQARSYAELGWLYDTEDILEKMNTNGIPNKSQREYATFYADYLIKEGKYGEAIPYLQTAIKKEKKKLQRTRMKYLLGQLYTDQGEERMAYKMFGEVFRANPPYELEFAARIRQTEVFSDNDFPKVVKMLEKMAKSDKNKELLDQVYYALGNIYLNRQDTANAIANYELGVEKSTRDGIEKAILQIKLGDLYFGMREYVKAQPCFSGALAGIQKEHKDYKRVAKLSEVLDELVIHVEAVHLQDSLQTLARMPESERLAVIDKIIEQVIKEEEEAKALAEKEAYLAEMEGLGGIDRPGSEINAPVMPGVGGGGAFYFYNAQTVAQGKNQFQRKWGRRTLEDNWRRRNKKMSTFNEFPDDQIAENEQESFVEPLPNDSISEPLEPVAADDPKTREYYIQQLPLTPEDIDASNIIIEDGLFNMAMIYKDKLEDLPLSIEAFEHLEYRFPENEHRLESYYQIFLMALRLDNTALATRYKNKLMAEYPESNYAVAVADPDYAYNIRMMDVVQDSIYQTTYDHYLEGDTAVVRQNFRHVNTKYPLANLLPKFMFLDALSYVQAGDTDGFKEALKTLLEKYPSADVSELAGEMLKGVLRGRAIVQGNIKGMTWNMRFGLGEDGQLSAADSLRTFTTEYNAPYRMVLIYPTGSIDKNQLLFAVAAYNFANFMVKEFDLIQQESGPVSMLIITGFNSFEEIAHYYKMIYGSDGYATALTRDVTVLPISDNNFETLMRGKTLDEYITFFEEAFGADAEEMVARWIARRDADMQEMEEAQQKEETPEPPQEVQPLIEEEKEEEIPVIPEEIPEPVEEEKQQQEEVLLPEIPLEEMIIPDTIIVQESPEEKQQVVRPPVNEKELTLKDIEEIRRREAEEKIAREEEERLIREAKEKEALELKEQQTREREAQRKLQEEEEAALLKAKQEREKLQERERKEKLKQAEAERKAKEKARKQLQREKEKEYKAKQRQQEKERNAKLKQAEADRRAKEKARQEELRAKEKARKEALKARDTSRKR